MTRDWSRRRFLAAAAITPFAASCTSEIRAYDFEWLAFATTIRATLYCEQAKLARAVFIALKQDFANINKAWYAWGDGELAKVNRSLFQTGESEVSRPLANVLVTARRLADRSSRHFSAALGPVIKLWQFDRFDINEPPVAPPGASELKNALTIANGEFQVSVPPTGKATITAPRGAMIDIGGIAKGAALKVGIETLQHFGIEGAIIDAGGDVATLAGDHPQDYRVGILSPRGRGVDEAVRILPGEHIMTSGDYARYWTLDGKRYQHIINPATGWPATGAMSATVIDKDPLLADATATALIVGGTQNFSTLCDAMQVQAARLVDNNGIVSMTSSFRSRLDT
ncbi:MAG: FAD:protein FMN transferase [Pseudomonadota bacterium]